MDIRTSFLYDQNLHSIQEQHKLSNFLCLRRQGTPIRTIGNRLLEVLEVSHHNHFHEASGTHETQWTGCLSKKLAASAPFWECVMP